MRSSTYVDLQKVTMLPAYNQHFAPVGTKSKSKIVPVLYNTGIRERKQENIKSFIIFFRYINLI